MDKWGEWENVQMGEMGKLEKCANMKIWEMGNGKWEMRREKGQMEEMGKYENGSNVRMRAMWRGRGRMEREKMGKRKY